jgi:hypothetical protein
VIYGQRLAAFRSFWPLAPGSNCLGPMMRSLPALVPEAALITDMRGNTAPSFTSGADFAYSIQQKGELDG